VRHAFALLRLGFDSPWRIRRNLARLLLSPVYVSIMRLQGADVGRNARLFGRPVVLKYRGSTVRVGDNVELRSAALSNVLGVGHRVILATLNADARIDIGDAVALSGTSICAACSVSIGPRSIVGVDSLITDTDHHPLAGPKPRYSLEGVMSAPIVIGEEVFIGARVVILKGVSIGDRAVIGAGSVVTASVPSDALAVGNPARVVGAAIGSLLEQPARRERDVIGGHAIK
jgi:acetyltransferase-like isoleucine patch superfamily enzyme